jgi:hypothetical protein
MPIIAFLGNDITDYQANSAKYLENLHFYCPEHGLELTSHAEYDRHVKDYNAVISILRLGCPLENCHYTRAVLPDFLQPYKHYSAHEIASVLIETESDVCALAIETEASISTVRRWISQYQPILDEKISQLKAAIFQISKRVVDEMALPFRQPMETIQRLLSLLPAINRTNTLGAAFIYANALAIPT